MKLIKKEVQNELLKAQAKHKLQYEKEKRMYQKMMSGVSETNKKTDSKTKSNSQKNDSFPLFSYAAAGLVIAAASIGVAMFAKYKNLL